MLGQRDEHTIERSQAEAIVNKWRLSLSRFSTLKVWENDKGLYLFMSNLRERDGMIFGTMRGRRYLIEESTAYL